MAQQETLPISTEQILFGSDPTERVVAVEPCDTGGLWLYRREADTVVREHRSFRPWILLAEPPERDLSGASLTQLEGEGLRWLAEFPDLASWQEARFRVREAHLENLTYASPVKLGMIRTGITCFKGMVFDDVVRLQFDLETTGLDSSLESARILLIAVSDNRGLLDLIEGDERDILDRFCALVAERDPDVLEGHSLFGFDMPYLLGRARALGAQLPLGRDRSEPQAWPERNYAIGGMSRPFIPHSIHGRHLVDTYLVVQRFDWAKQALTRYGLKECARVFGFAREERIELPREQMTRLYSEETEAVRTYALQDAEETRLLADLITPVEFYQAQMAPDAYGSVVVTGNGEKINSILLRAYLGAGRAVPRQQPSRPYAGGFSEVRRCGVLQPIVKADVESLYPSLMLHLQAAPESDTLGVFLPALAELTHRRIEAKRMAAAADRGTTDHHYWDGLQGSFKVLINSFYGYLGGPFAWNDYRAAERVTARGRELVQAVSGRIEQTGGQVVEVDTDGVYFVPPPAVMDEAAERAYVTDLGAVLPADIRLAFDGRYSRMLSVKTKNYVLQTYDGRKIMKGASLRSRADEGYGRRFLARVVDLLLEGDREAIRLLYEETIEDIRLGRVPIEELARRERITEKTFASDQKRRSAAVARNVPVGDSVSVYERADGSLGLLDEYAGDANSKYYMDKLYKFARRLEDAFDGEFQRLIVKPTAQGLPHQSQTSLDLF